MLVCILTDKTEEEMASDEEPRTVQIEEIPGETTRGLARKGAAAKSIGVVRRGESERGSRPTRFASSDRRKDDSCAPGRPAGPRAAEDVRKRRKPNKPRNKRPRRCGPVRNIRP